MPKPQASATAADRLLRSPPAPAGRLQAQALHVAGRREPHLGAEAAREMARAHVGTLGERLDREVGSEVLHGVALHLTQYPIAQARERRAWR